MTKRIAIIPARGGSKRIPRKNLRHFLGKPIISYSISAALDSKLFDEVMVSTDDPEIAEVAQNFGASVPFIRSKKASDDYSTITDVLLEVVDNYSQRGVKIGLACCIFATAPFVTADKLQRAIELLIESGADTVLPIARMGFPIWRSFRKEKDNIFFNWPEFAMERSQDLPAAYQDTGQFYFFRPPVLLAKSKLITDNTIGIEVSEIEMHDIDTEDDWRIAELKYDLISKSSETSDNS